jgi:hypothetical protein
MEGAYSFTFDLLAEIGVRATHTVDFQAHLRAHLRLLFPRPKDGARAHCAPTTPLNHQTERNYHLYTSNP